MPRIEDHPWIRSILAADISNRTKDQYVRISLNLQKLAHGRGLEDVIAHPKAMIKRIEKEYDSLQTRKSHVSAIKAILKYNPDLQEEYKDQALKWAEYFRTLDRAITERVASAEPTQRELLNWVEWKDVVRKQYEMGLTEYGSVPHLLLSMYSLIEPIRADYGDVRIIHEGSRESRALPEDANYVYLSQRSGESKLVLHSYKTSKKYGTFERILPDQLVSIIAASLTKEPRAYLFVDEFGHPYEKKNSYTRFANRTFERIFGKKFTISLVRHSFVSSIDFNETTPLQLMQHSKNMMHSISMQQMYRRKVVPKLKVEKVFSSPVVQQSIVQQPVSSQQPRTLLI